MAKMADVSLVESQELNAGERVGGGWEVVERYTRENSKGAFMSSSTTLRNRIGQGFLVRTFYQFYDGVTMHVSMSQTYVPDPNEQWSVEDTGK